MVSISKGLLTWLNSQLDPENHHVLMETSLPTLTTARVKLLIYWRVTWLHGDHEPMIGCYPSSLHPAMHDFNEIYGGLILKDIGISDGYH